MLTLRRRSATLALAVAAAVLSALLMSAVLTSCGGTPAPASTPSGETSKVVVDITLKDGQTTPSGDKIDVAQGQTVVLNVTSDHEDAIHVHGGYDIELEVQPDVPATEEFVADRTGSVEIESHHPEKIIVILIIR